MQLADRLGRRVKLRDLNVFLAVVEAGSMARAAERLAVSRPVVSKTIADLEHSFGVPLFDRSRHGVEPTAYGRALVSRGAAVFDELRLAARDIERLADPSAGEVRIGAAEAMIAGLLPHAIEQLQRGHPRMVFHVRSTVAGPWLYEALRERQVAFAVGRMAVQPTDTDLEAEVLYHERLFVAAGKDMRLPAHRPLRVQHLLDAPWILPRADTEVGILMRRVFRSMGVEPPRETITSNSTLMTCSLLASGRFLGVLPGSLLRFGEMRNWVRIVLALPETPPGPVAVVTMAGRTLAPAAGLFIAHLRLLTADMGEAPIGDRSG